MTKKYRDLAKNIVADLGGKENITDAYHCQTRLRFKLADDSLVQVDKLEALDGVAKYIVNAGVYQVVIGTNVADVFEEVAPLVDLSTTTATTSNDEAQPKLMAKIIDFVTGTFQPIIPALSGAGMVKAVLALLVVFKVITTTSQTYYMLNVFSDGVFFFLPIMLAFTEARKLKANPILAASVAAMMLHPNWTALVTAGKPVTLFNVLPFTLATYSSTVIPIILIVFVQAYVEKWLNKFVPRAVNLVFVPMLTFLIMGTLAFSILGPIGAIIGNYLSVVFTYLSVNVSWAPAVLIGGLLPIMVMFGIHNGIAPLGVMQMAQTGYDSIFGPGCVCSNIAQATAAAVVAFRTKDKKTRELAVSGSVTAYMGITEPVLYGVNLPKRYPLVAAMFGGAAGGLYAGLTHTHRFATGSSGLPAILLYIGNNSMTFLRNIVIALIISAVVSGVMTYLLSFKYETSLKTPKVAVDGGETIIAAPIPGKIIDLKAVKDEAFASGALGQGFAIQPTDGRVNAPFDGQVVALFPTNHAIGLKSDTGVELLIHIGLNTVDLNGKYFEAFVKLNDRVKKDQLLIMFDVAKIAAAGYDTTVPVVVTNSNDAKAIDLLDQNANQDAGVMSVVL